MSLLAPRNQDDDDRNARTQVFKIVVHKPTGDFTMALDLCYVPDSTDGPDSSFLFVFFTSFWTEVIDKLIWSSLQHLPWNWKYIEGEMFPLGIFWRSRIFFLKKKTKKKTIRRICSNLFICKVNISATAPILFPVTLGKCQTCLHFCSLFIEHIKTSVQTVSNLSTALQTYRGDSCLLGYNVLTKI